MSSMIVAPQPRAVEAGAQVLLDGGNAIDAAVTCAFTQGILSPHSCGIGGYAVTTIHLADGSSISLDAPALAGSGVTPDMWEDAVNGPNPEGWGYFLEGKVNDVGYSSICVPGAVRALATVLERWGTISWEDAISPAIRLAENGFLVSNDLANGWKATAGFPEASSLRDRAHATAAARRIYAKPGGGCHDTGEILRNPDYADTLRTLAERGADDFYHGATSDRMAADLAEHGSNVTRDDLEQYELRDDPPLTGSYRGYTVATIPAPHGGPTLLAILNILEGYDLGSIPHNSAEYIHLVASAMKAAFADRNPHLGDPEFVDVPVDWMVSKARAAEWRAEIDADEPIHVEFTPSEPPDTTHVSVVDGEGNAIAFTHSLGMSSGVITPGMGFMYNNSMINFHPFSGHPNSIAPGKSRTSGMTPAIIYKDGRPVLIIGAPGATRIITSVVQVILNVLDFDMSAADAVHAARFDCQSDLIRCQMRIPEMVCAKVREKHAIEYVAQSHGGLGLVHAITIDPVTGELAGGADTGAGGMAMEIRDDGTVGVSG